MRAEKEQRKSYGLTTASLGKMLGHASAAPLSRTSTASSTAFWKLVACLFEGGLFPCGHGTARQVRRGFLSPLYPGR